MMFWRSRTTERRSIVDGDGHVSWLALQGLGGGSYSGRGAEAIATVTSCINLIATTIAQLPPVIKRDNRRVDNHTLRSLLLNPSRDLSFNSWMALMVTEHIISGNAIAVMRSVRGRLELTYVPWVNVTWFDEDSYKLTLPTVYGRNTEVITVPAGEVLHWRAMTGSRDGGFTGRSILQRCAQVVNLTGILDKSVQSYFTNGAAPSGLFSIKGQLNADQRKQLHTDFSEQYSGSVNTGKPLILGGEASYQPVGNTADDAQLNQIRSYQVREIARVFNVPPSFLAVEGAQTYASIYEATKHLALALRSYTSSFSAAFGVKFLQPNEQLVLDDSELIKEPLAVRAAAHAQLIAAGVYDAAYAAEMENIERREGVENVSK